MTERQHHDGFEARAPFHQAVAFLGPATCLLLFLLFLLGAIKGLLGHESASAPPTADWAMLLLRTAGVAVGIGVLATLVALPPAWLMRRISWRWAGVLCAPLLLPTYLVYAAWNLLRAPGSAIGDRLVELDPVWDRLFGDAIAIGGLALWAWPLAAIILASRFRRIDDDLLDSLRLTTNSAWRRLGVVVGLCRGTIAASISVVSAVMLGSAVPLHVAQVPTYAIHIWRVLSETAGSAAAWRAAWPLILIAIVAGWALSGALVGMTSVTSQTGVVPGGKPARRTMIGAGIVWGCSVLLPLGLLINALNSPTSLRRFWSEDAPSMLQSGQTALIVGAICIIITGSTAFGMSGGHSSWVRRLTTGSVRLWIIGALLPGILVGQALLELSGWAGFHWIGDSQWGLVLSHLLRFGAVAALAGWWIAWIEPDALRSARRLFAGDGVRAWLAGSARLEFGVMAGAAVGVALLSLHEIEAAVILAPPGYDLFAQRMLSMLHYLRDENLTAAAIHLLVGGILLASVAALLAGRSADAWNRARRASRRMG